MFLVWKKFLEAAYFMLFFLSELGICNSIASAYRSHDVFGVAEVAKENSFSIGIRF